MVHVIFSGSTLPLITRWIHRFFAKNNWLFFRITTEPRALKPKQHSIKNHALEKKETNIPQIFDSTVQTLFMGRKKNIPPAPVTKVVGLPDPIWEKLVSKITFQKWCATTCRQPQPTNHSWPTCLGELQRAVWVVNVCVYCQETWVEANFTSP